MMKAKLYAKMSRRVGKIAVNKHTLESGQIRTVTIEENRDGSYRVYYTLAVKDGAVIRLRTISEDSIVILLEPELC